MGQHRKLTKRELVRKRIQAKKRVFKRLATPKSYERPEEFAEAPQAKGETITGDDNPDAQNDEAVAEDNNAENPEEQES